MEPLDRRWRKTKAGHLGRFLSLTQMHARKKKRNQAVSQCETRILKQASVGEKLLSERASSNIEITTYKS